MFRQPQLKSKLDPANFGAGSTISIGKNEHYLVVDCSGRVAVVNMADFVISEVVDVDDANWLTELEARELVSTGINSATFSDCTFKAVGLKA